jgi:cellulose biosynthesis protein BcsQ
VKLGAEILKRVFNGKTTRWDRDFLLLLLEQERGHEVVVRRLLRYAHGDPGWRPQAATFIHQLPAAPSYDMVRAYWRELDEAPPDKARKPPKGSRKKGTKVVTVAAPRGGVGKTTVGYFLAGRLAAAGLKTCFVELDIADPTVYFVDEKLRKNLRDRADKGKGGDNPIAALWDRWADDGPKGLRKAVKDLPYAKTVRSRDGTKRTFDVFPAVPFEVSGRAAEVLAAATASKNHAEFLSDLVAALEEAGGYHYVIVDTAAGLRDFSAAMVGLKETDVVLMLAQPTKLSVLSSLESLGHRPKGTAARRLFVLNAARDIDRELFAGVEEVIDFCVHWGRNGDNKSTFKSMERMVADFRQNCDGYCRIPWNEGWMRLEVNVDAGVAPSKMGELLDDFIAAVRRAAEGDE